MSTGFWWGKLIEGDHLEDPGIGGNAVLIKLEDFFLAGCGTVRFSWTLLHGGRRFIENWNGVKT